MKRSTPLPLKTPSSSLRRGSRACTFVVFVFAFVFVFVCSLPCTLLTRRGVDAVCSPEELVPPKPVRRAAARSDIAVDLRQLIVIVTTLNKDATMLSIAELYRDAYDTTLGGVTLANFTEVAQRRQLFSDSLRLPPFVGAMRATTLARSELQQLASIVHRKSSLLNRDLGPWVTVLPEPWGRHIKYLRQAVQQVGVGVCVLCLCL